MVSPYLDIMLTAATTFAVAGIGVKCELPLLHKIFTNRRAFLAGFIGIFCQFIILPSICWMLGYFCGVAGTVGILGFVMTGAMPGGSTSNIFTMWSKGSLELSVFMTTVSTVIAFGMIPFWLFLVTTVSGFELTGGGSINYEEMGKTFGLMVAALIVGVAWGQKFPSTRNMVARVVSIVFFILILLSIASVVFLYQDVIFRTPVKVVVASIMLWPLGAGGSYLLSTLFGFAPATCRTITMEIGVQNLALAYAVMVRVIDNDDDFARIVSFPLLYTLCMYIFGGIAVMVFRRIHDRNIRLGIEEKDEEFFNKSTTIDSTTESEVPKTDEEISGEQDIVEESMDVVKKEEVAEDLV